MNAPIDTADPAVQAAVAAALPGAIASALPGAIAPAVRNAIDAATVARPLLTKAEVTEHLGVSVSTLDKMIRRGEIAWTRVGAGVRFTPQQVADFVRANAARGVTA